MDFSCPKFKVRWKFTRRLQTSSTTSFKNTYTFKTFSLSFPEIRLPIMLRNIQLTFFYSSFLFSFLPSQRTTTYVTKKLAFTSRTMSKLYFDWVELTGNNWQCERSPQTTISTFLAIGKSSCRLWLWTPLKKGCRRQQQKEILLKRKSNRKRMHLTFHSQLMLLCIYVHILFQEWKLHAGKKKRMEWSQKIGGNAGTIQDWSHNCWKEWNSTEKD